MERFCLRTPIFTFSLGTNVVKLTNFCFKIVFHSLSWCWLFLNFYLWVHRVISRSKDGMLLVAWSTTKVPRMLCIWALTESNSLDEFMLKLEISLPCTLQWRVPFEILEIIKKMQPSEEQAYCFILIGKACHCMDVKVGFVLCWLLNT